jgi:hypothetical protein
MLIVLLGLFVMFRGPWHLADLIIDALVSEEDEESIPSLDIIRQLATVLVFINSWTTPVIYSMFNERVRDQMLNSFRCRRRLKDTSPSPEMQTIMSCFRISRISPAAATTAATAAATRRQQAAAPEMRVAVIVIADE